MRLRYFILLVAILGTVFLLFRAHGAEAQQASPKEQALTQELIQSINNNITCKTDVVTLQQEIQKLRAELAQYQKSGKKNEPAKKKP